MEIEKTPWLKHWRDTQRVFENWERKNEKRIENEKKNKTKYRKLHTKHNWTDSDNNIQSKWKETKHNEIKDNSKSIGQMEDGPRKSEGHIQSVRSGWSPYHHKGLSSTITVIWRSSEIPLIEYARHSHEGHAASGQWKWKKKKLVKSK